MDYLDIDTHHFLRDDVLENDFDGDNGLDTEPVHTGIDQQPEEISDESILEGDKIQPEEIAEASILGMGIVAAGGIISKQIRNRRRSNELTYQELPIIYYYDLQEESELEKERSRSCFKLSFHNFSCSSPFNLKALSGVYLVLRLICLL